MFFFIPWMSECTVWWAVGTISSQKMDCQGLLFNGRNPGAICKDAFPTGMTPLWRPVSSLVYDHYFNKCWLVRTRFAKCHFLKCYIFNLNVECYLTPACVFYWFLWFLETGPLPYCLPSTSCSWCSAKCMAGVPRGGPPLLRDISPSSDLSPILHPPQLWSHKPGKWLEHLGFLECPEFPCLWLNSW